MSIPPYLESLNKDRVYLGKDQRLEFTRKLALILQESNALSRVKSFVHFDKDLVLYPFVRCISFP